MREDDRDPLADALAGDEDAIESAIVSVHAPIFDVALHWLGPERAADAAKDALAALAVGLREARVPDPSLLGAGLAQIFQRDAEGRFRPAPFAALAAPLRFAWLAHLAAEEGPTELAPVVGLTSQALAQAFAAAPPRAALEALRDALDEAAMAVPMPIDLLDRALGEEGLDDEG